MSTLERFRDCGECGGTGETQDTKNLVLPGNGSLAVSLKPKACRVCGGTGRIDIIDQINDQIKILRKIIVARYFQLLLGFGSLVYLTLFIASALDSTLAGAIVILIGTALLLVWPCGPIRTARKNIADRVETIELILQLDSKAKYGIDPDQITIDDQPVAAIQLIDNQSEKLTATTIFVAQQHRPVAITADDIPPLNFDGVEGLSLQAQ